MNKNQRYIGDKRIKEAKEKDGKVYVTFEDKTEQILKKEMFDEIATKNEVDATELRDRRVTPVVKEILQLMLDWDIKLDEYEYLMSSVKMSLENSLKNASEKVWGMKMEDRKMSDIDKIIKE